MPGAHCVSLDVVPFLRGGKLDFPPALAAFELCTDRPLAQERGGRWWSAIRRTGGGEGFIELHHREELSAKGKAAKKKQNAKKLNGGGDVPRDAAVYYRVVYLNRRRVPYARVVKAVRDGAPAKVEHAWAVHHDLYCLARVGGRHVYVADDAGPLSWESQRSHALKHRFGG